MEYKLIDIKNWYVTNTQLIPEIQRDLVWSPKQIVMLWDSILRGFTIGSFIILQNEEGELQVLDGQQRINAIAQGFGTYNVSPSKELCKLIEPDLVLWFDLGGTVQGTKLFPLMITTKSQPWGYNNDEDCSKLTSSVRRESLKLYFGNEYNCEDIYNQDVSLYQTWPVKAIAPIPLHIILNHISDENENVFANNIIDEFENSPFTHRKFDDNYINKLKSYYNIFRKLQDFSIGNPTISSTIFESERDDMEILFNRINRGGTNMSDDDLAYSTIKAHFEDAGIKNKDSSVINYIAPAKLARLLFRIADSINKKSFVSDFEYKKIREYSKDAEFVKRISDYYKNIKETIQQVESIFNECNVPKVLRVDIANKSTELYMLLVFLTLYDKELKKDDSKKQFICGLIFYLRWFCDNVTKAVNIIKKHIFDNDFSEKNFKRAISEIIGLDILTPLITPNQLSNLFILRAEKNWTDEQCNAPEFWDKIRENRNLLLFYQREYLNKTFGNYNPANSKLWNDNCPWDYDHIIPQNWFGSYSTKNQFARFNKYWQNNIGNLAAILFARNRSKSDNADWNYYKEKKLLDENSINALTHIDSKKFNSDDKMAKSFADFTFERCLNIYMDCYNTLFKYIFVWDDDITEIARKRKCLFEEIKEKYEDVHFYYVTQDASRELPVNSHWAWSMPWMSCGFILKDIYYVALTSFLDYNNISEPQLLCEIGIRRCPGHLTISNKFPGQLTNELKSKGQTIYTDNNWWYVARDINVKKESLNTDTIVKELNELASVIENIKEQ